RPGRGVPRNRDASHPSKTDAIQTFTAPRSSPVRSERHPAQRVFLRPAEGDPFMPRRSKHRAILIARPRPGQSEVDVQSSLIELGLLLQGLGIEVAETLSTRRSAPFRAVLGEGKRDEVRARIDALA